MRAFTLMLACAGLLFPTLTSAQHLTFSDESQFFNVIQSQTIIEFEEVEDTDSLSITAQNGTFTRESVHFAVEDTFGNSGFGQVIGRDFFETIGLDPYNLGSGDFFEAVSELPITVGMNFDDVDPVAVGLRLDSRIGTGELSVIVRTIENSQIETFDFGVDTGSVDHAFFGFISTGQAKVLDVTVTGDVGSPTPRLELDRITYAPISTVPGPAALPLFGAGLAVLGLRLHRRGR